jgi:hypothetical protein
MDIEGSKPGRTFVYAHHKDKELTRPARAFLELVKTYSIQKSPTPDGA